MNRLEAITEAYLLATGKATLPTGSKLEKLRSLAKKFHRDIQTEPGIEWGWLYQVVSGGTVTATDTFELDTAINYISKDEQLGNNCVRILSTGNQYLNYKSVKPSELYPNRFRPVVAKIADNQIQFGRAFTSADQAFGGAIQVPAIIKLDDLASDTDDVPDEMSQWLPVRIAAQYVLTDSQLNYLYQDLIDQANEQLEGMKDRNSTGNEKNSTGVDYFSSMGNVWS